MKPWENEPDEVEGEFYGLPVYIKRVEDLGHLCGYVRVPEGHPAYELDCCAWDHPIIKGCNVHGGLTYSQPFLPFLKPEEDEVWWLGFDCAHAGDLSPFREALGLTITDEVYRDMEYVKHEVEMLAMYLSTLQQSNN